MSVKLSPLSIEHVPLIVEAAQESIAEINPWMPWCSAEFGIREAEEFVKNQMKAWSEERAYEFAFFDQKGSYLGGGGVNSVCKENNVANVGYWIRTSKAQNGYGTAAVSAMVNWARDNTDLNRLELVIAKGNIASQRVAEKAGAESENIAKSRLLIHGQYHDALIFAFTKNV